MSQPLVKVNREGVITVDGTVVGHVKKEMRQGLFATALGASYSGGGTAYWTPFGDDGTQLSEYGCDTRKRAVDLVVKHAQPLSVSDVKLEYGLGVDAKCVTAWVKWRGYAFGVSRYAHESEWVVDCLFTPASMMPTFSHGTGTRYTRLSVLKPEMADAATRAAIDAGVWPMVEVSA